MFIPQGTSGIVDLNNLNPVVDAIRNNRPWIVWGFMDITQGNYNMVECSSFSDNTVTFYDTNLTNAFIRYWTINLNDGTFTREDNQLNYATTSYVDSAVSNVEVDLSDYYNKTEVNALIDNIEGGSDIPTVIITSNNVGLNLRVLSGNLDNVINAAINGNAFIAYYYCGSNPGDYGEINTLYGLRISFDNTYSWETTKGSFGYHTELNATAIYPHIDVKINFEWDSNNNTYTLVNMRKYVHYYATTDYVDNQIGDINTILENIIG